MSYSTNQRLDIIDGTHGAIKFVEGLMVLKSQILVPVTVRVRASTWPCS